MGQTYNKQEATGKTLHQHGFCRYKSGHFGMFFFSAIGVNDNNAGIKTRWKDKHAF